MNDFCTRGELSFINAIKAHWDGYLFVPFSTEPEVNRNPTNPERPAVSVEDQLMCSAGCTIHLRW